MFVCFAVFVGTFRCAKVERVEEKCTFVDEKFDVSSRIDDSMLFRKFSDRRVLNFSVWVSIRVRVAFRFFCTFSHYVTFYFRNNKISRVKKRMFFIRFFAA